MQIALSIVLFITLIVAVYYQQKSFKLQKDLELICRQINKKELKSRATLDLVKPIVEEYHKNIDKANAYIYMRMISDILIKD